MADGQGIDGGQWPAFWQFVRAGALAAAAAPARAASLDLDFLADMPDEPTPAAEAPLQRAPAGTARAAQFDAAELARCAPPQWADDPALATVDGEAAHWLLQIVAAGASATEHGSISRLAERALRTGDSELAHAAVQAMAQAKLAALQVAAAERFGREVRAMPAPARTIWLDALAAVGDGRCVRPLEAVLADAGAALDDHQAWRLRHIVQVIRRGGRR